MKKLGYIIFAMAVLLSVGCSSNSQEQITTSQSSNETNAEISTTASESSSKADSETSEPSETSEKALFQGDGYTFQYDTELWNNDTHYTSEVLELIEGYEGIDEVVIFTSLNDNQGYFNIVSQEIGEVGEDFNIGDYEAAWVEQVKDDPSFANLTSEVVSVNGYSSVKFDYECEGSGYLSKRNQYIFIEGTKKYVFTFSTVEDAYEESFGYFDELIATIKFD